MRQLRKASPMLLVAPIIGCGQSIPDPLEANKALVRQLGAINNGADWDKLDTLLSDYFRRHSMATTRSPEISSPDEFKRHEQAIRSLYPDRHVKYEMMIAEGSVKTNGPRLLGRQALKHKS